MSRVRRLRATYRSLLGDKGYASEAMMAFSDGELRIGRRAIEASEPQSFFGMSLFTNGTAKFTNRVEGGDFRCVPPEIDCSANDFRL